MNFYEHHLGDYMRDTAHLSMLEDAAYRRLLDAYYIRERPLPADLQDCCRLIRATSEQERTAVSQVLKEFFQLQTDGYHQRRCDAEIKRYQDKRAKAKASAAARWAEKQQESERNANALPTHTERNASAVPTHTERIADAVPTQSERSADAMPSDGIRMSERNANGMLSSPQSPVLIPPTPLTKWGDDAHTRSERKPRTLTDASAIAWAKACQAIDAVKGHRDKTWADADVAIADAKITAAILTIGGHRVVSQRDRYTQGELKRRFRAHYEQLLGQSDHGRECAATAQTPVATSEESSS